LKYINSRKQKKNPHFKDSFNVLDSINVYVSVFCSVTPCSLVKCVGIYEEFAASIIIGEGSTSF